MDKVRLPDRRKPPKQARFPNALGRAKTDSSKLVAGAGVSGSSPLVGSPYCAASRERPMLIQRAAKKQLDVPLGCAQCCGKGRRIEQVLAPALLQRPHRCCQIVGEQQKCCRLLGAWDTAIL